MGKNSSRRIRVQMHDAGGRKVEIAVTQESEKEEIEMDETRTGH